MDDILRPRDARRQRRSLLWLLLACPLAVAAGLAIHKIPHRLGWDLIAAVPVVLVLGFVLARGPRLCLALLVVTAVLGWDAHSIVGGQHGLRVIDIFWVGLVAWTLSTRAKEGPLLGRQVGQRQLGLWLLALFVSLYPVAVRAPGGFTDALIAWARLAQTLSLVWLVPYAVRKVADVEYLLRVVELAIGAEILFAIMQWASKGDLESRLSGANGPDTTGLFAVLLIAAAIHAPVPRHRALRGLMLVIGAAGLVMTKSVGSILAVGVVLCVFGLRSMAEPRRSPHQGLLVPARLLLVVFAMLTIAAIVRPGSLPGSPAFGQSTTMDRTVVATAGLELFRDQPVVGVGWSRAPYVIGSDKIDHQLRALFGNSVRQDFLPKQDPTSVHNIYIEILAESGLLGFACFVALLVVAVRGIRRVLRDAADDRRVAACAWCAVVLLVGVLVWWNDNALFGAQPETVLAATFLGMLAATPVVARRAVTPDAGVGSAADEVRRLAPR